MHSQQFQECHPGLIHKVIMGKYTVTSKSHFDIASIEDRDMRVSVFLSLIVHALRIPKAAVGHVSLHAGIKNRKQQKAQNAERLSERDTVCYDVTIDLPARGFSHLITSPRPKRTQCR
jgi:hypothetical protein